MSKRKATFTKETAAQNQAIVARAIYLLDYNDLDTVASQRKEVIAQLTQEFSGVSQVRIIAKIAKAIRRIRFIKMNKYAFFYPENNERFTLKEFNTPQGAIGYWLDRRPTWSAIKPMADIDEAAFISPLGEIVVVRELNRE